MLPAGTMYSVIVLPAEVTLSRAVLAPCEPIHSQRDKSIMDQRSTICSRDSSRRSQTLLTLMSLYFLIPLPLQVERL